MAFKINRPYKPTINCQFCATFIFCPADYRYPKEGERYCPCIKKNVKLTTDSCPEVQLAKYFYCDALNCQMDVVACLNRRERAIDNCASCKIGDLLAIYVAEEGIRFEKDGRIKEIPK